MRPAYVTLVTKPAYVDGAVALANSLRLTGTRADFVVMHTGAVDAEALAPLASATTRLHRVELLDTSPAFNAAHDRARLHGAAPFTKGRKPDFHTPLDNFAKLRLWQLTEYDRIVYLDADTVVLQNIDILFDYPEFAAAPNVYQKLADFHRLNSGVFTARPSETTFAAMMAALDVPGVFWRRTDQTFLQSFFPGWHGLPVFFNTLQHVWVNLPDLWDWDSIRVLHYQYEKPWERDHPRPQQLAPLISVWHEFHAGRRPDIRALPGPTGRDAA